jgi:hypothetical protein
MPKVAGPLQKAFLASRIKPKIEVRIIIKATGDSIKILVEEC